MGGEVAESPEETAQRFCGSRTSPEQISEGFFWMGFDQFPPRLPLFSAGAVILQHMNGSTEPYTFMCLRVERGLQHAGVVFYAGG